MCVRELRSTEAPNVIVFYLAFISSLGALVGTTVQVSTLGTQTGDQNWGPKLCKPHTHWCAV